MTRTRWFPPNVSPVRKGDYECQNCGRGVRHHWNGKRWLIREGTKLTAPLDPFFWRGLAEPPK